MTTSKPAGLQWPVLLAFACLLAGCATPKSLTYLQDLEYQAAYAAPPAPELRIQPGDRLGITVMSPDPQLAAPFNGALSASETTAAQRTAQYIVDPEGNINFPVLGMLPVEGRTAQQIKNDLTARIRESGYIRDPVVGVSLDSFTITVLGNVSNGVLTVEGPSINLLQAIARSGGTADNAKIKDVMVIRTEDGQRTAYPVNLQKKALFDSPVFYLHQNDIVYVKPQGSTLTTEGQTALTLLGSALSAASAVIYILYWTTH
jgi:polysaccharide export outer membrane protein